MSVFRILLLISCAVGILAQDPDPNPGQGQFQAPPEQEHVKFEPSDAIENPGLNPTKDEESSAPTEEEEEEPEVDENAKLASDLYTSASSLLNSSSSNKKRAWEMMVRAASLGHTGATVKLAWAQITGMFLRQDIESASQAFTAAAELGYPDAQTGLGFLYATGTATNSSQSKALLYYTFAAFGGSSWAQMAFRISILGRNGRCHKL